MDRKAPLPSLRKQKPTWSKAAALARDWELTQLAKRLEELASPLRTRPAAAGSPFVHWKMLHDAIRKVPCSELKPANSFGRPIAIGRDESARIVSIDVLRGLVMAVTIFGN